MSSLRIENLSCGYPSRTVLKHVTLTAEPGKMTVLLGANGAGKTTFFRTLSGQLPPLAGSFRLADREFGSYSLQDRVRELAVMPQSESRDWPLTVEEAVNLGRAPHRGWLFPLTEEDHRVVEEAIVRTCLEELRERPITELSGGEWRRVILARALAQEARYLLLDEPTAGLDLKYQHEVLHLIQSITHDRKLTTVLSLHDLNLAALFGDEIALLGDESLIAVGPPADVLTEDLIQHAFGIPVSILKHPVYGTPLIAPLSGQHTGDHP
ncbi:MAG: ABC transporter ATP-binding protein [Planctomycetaceae bacterium]|nr:ABC transporter ATP-binding protein [Planctomycetaceae bacterium]